MSAFDYARPTDLAEALSLLAQPGSVPLAGGQALLLAMRNGGRSATRLVDLKHLDTLRAIEFKDDRLRIGALVTHHQLSEDHLLQRLVPGCAAAAQRIADPAVRYRATLGGSLAENHPAGDHAAILSALGATVHSSIRDIPIGDLLRGPYATGLGEGELVLAVSFSVPKRFGYAKAPHPASKYALAGVAVAAFEDKVRLAVTGAGAEGVFRWEGAERALERAFTVAALNGLHCPETVRLQDDHHASAGYRARLVEVMSARAVSAALAYA